MMMCSLINACSRGVQNMHLLNCCNINTVYSTFFSEDLLTGVNLSEGTYSLTKEVVLSAERKYRVICRARVGALMMCFFRTQYNKLEHRLTSLLYLEYIS